MTAESQAASPPEPPVDGPPPRGVDVAAHLAAAACGVVVWLVWGTPGELKVALDPPGYLRTGYPVLGLMCGVIGVLRPGAGWRIGFTAAAAQLVVVVLRAGEVGALIPLGVLLVAVFGTPLALLAALGGRLRRPFRRADLLVVLAVLPAALGA